MWGNANSFDWLICILLRNQPIEWPQIFSPSEIFPPHQQEKVTAPTNLSSRIHRINRSGDEPPCFFRMLTDGAGSYFISFMCLCYGRRVSFLLAVMCGAWGCVIIITFSRNISLVTRKNWIFILKAIKVVQNGMLSCYFRLAPTRKMTLIQ